MGGKKTNTAKPSTPAASTSSAPTPAAAAPTTAPTTTTSTANMSIARQNYHDACIEGLNQQINMELKASHIYLSLHAYFSRDNIALPGLAHFFKKSSDEEREHAQKMIDYQIARGGKVVLQSIAAPEIEWQSAKNAMEFTLSLEREVNKALLQLHAVADQNSDPHMADFIESEFLGEQVEAIKKISDLITQLNRVGADGLGLYLWDKDLQ